MRDSSDFNSGFLPHDYVEKKAERRMNVMAITLFILVMFGVTTAFMVTQKNWAGVRADRGAVNQRFIAANDRIAEMDAYELRVEQMVDKAHIAVGLVAHLFFASAFLAISFADFVIWFWRCFL